MADLPNGHHHRQNGGLHRHQRFAVLDGLIKAKRDPLEHERSLLEREIHPKYLARIGHCRERHQREIQRIEVEEKREIDRIEAAHRQEMDKLEREYQNRVNDLVETLWQELEDRKKQLDGDIAALEIGRWDGKFGGGTGSNTNWAHHHHHHHPNSSYANQWSGAPSGQGGPGKKQLRRRGNEQQPGISGATAMASGSGSSAMADTCGASGAPVEKKSRKRSGAGQACQLISQTLLSNQAINEDMEKLFPVASDRHSLHYWSSRGSAHSASGSSGQNASGQSGTGDRNEYHLAGDGAIGEDADAREQHQQGRKLRKVVLEHGKFVCDGKSFHRLQNVSIQSANTGGKPLQARVIQINELTVQFRSTIPGDIRTFTAAKEDLETGRVLVWKRY